MIPAAERDKMLAVDLCGTRVVARLEAIGVRRLADLAGRDPWELMHRANLRAGRPIWHPPMATTALGNLVEAADREAATRRAGSRSDGTLAPAR